MRGFSCPCQHICSPSRLGFDLSSGKVLRSAAKLPPKSFFSLHAGLHHPQHPTQVSVATMDTRARDIKTGNVKIGLGENGRKSPKSSPAQRRAIPEGANPQLGAQPRSRTACPGISVGATAASTSREEVRAHHGGACCSASPAQMCLCTPRS